MNISFPQVDLNKTIIIKEKGHQISVTLEKLNGKMISLQHEIENLSSKKGDKSTYALFLEKNLSLKKAQYILIKEGVISKPIIERGVEDQSLREEKMNDLALKIKKNKIMIFHCKTTYSQEKTLDSYIHLQEHRLLEYRLFDEYTAYRHPLPLPEENSCIIHHDSELERTIHASQSRTEENNSLQEALKKIKLLERRIHEQTKEINQKNETIDQLESKVATLSKNLLLEIRYKSEFVNSSNNSSK